jgi:hypothetical protein
MEEKDERSLLEKLPHTPPEVLALMRNSRIEHNHYAAIGRVAAGWAFLEALVDTWSMELAGLSTQPGVCLTSQIAGIARKLDAFISLARLRPISDALVKDLNDFAKLARGLSEKRNRLVHDVWYFDHPNPPEHLEATARKVLRFEYIPQTTEQILEFVRKIDQASDRFHELGDKVKACPAPSP